MGNATCDVHGVDEAQPFLHTAFADQRFDRGRDVDEAAAARNFKPKLFGERFHALDMPSMPRLLQPFQVANACLNHRRAR